MAALSGKKIAFLTAQVGVEKVELTTPWQAVLDAGGTPTLIAPEVSAVQSMVGDVDKDETFDADLAVAGASAADFDALVLPGGTVNADKVRADAASVALVTTFAEAGKPIAAICHGPWALVEAGVLPGKTLTSFPSLRTDITNAGGSWVDETVFHCPAQGWDLVTSRNPDDLDAFCSTLTDVFAKA
ncbi:type 1 glutamine amidotransferase domain-containing protein [Aeromicrobium wangtongii]|uniref:Type 1 glutamine amidotransferase n=1 Tax=Aeromicrobium wangtongii TaxID=2969247 RepID=A0ABY5M8J6_9ACTN|nr:type 1 glutamine amidotransferase domain-containing protein [Aeromicrobium wangtongii]MCD9199430.1 type 1 glutamine amidotransferase [Aeromicrobium wangtongii]UUP13787.1 type 1 glutamine amidotransferase [Aeromicrobium wangtongii]